MSAFARGAAGYLAAAVHAGAPRIKHRAKHFERMQRDMDAIARRQVKPKTP